MIKYIFLLIFLFNCSSVEIKEDKNNNSPIPTFGCQKYKGKEWESCIVKLMGKLESILNEKPKRTILSKDRQDDENVLYTYSYCLGNDDICFTVKELKYEPTTLGVIWSTTKKIGLGFVIGFLSGAYTVN